MAKARSLKAIVFVVSLLALGCSKFGRVSECRGLVETVNQGMDVIEPITRAPENTDKYKKLATEYRALAERVKKLPIAEGHAKGEVKDYADLLAQVATITASLENSLKNGTRTEGYRRELERLTRRERTSVSKLENYCQSP